MSDFNLSRTIDGGTISFEDGDKAASKADQYDVSRKVRVELNFSTFENSDDGEAVVEYVGNLARAQVARLLGTTAPAAVATGELPAPATRKRRTQAEIAADKAAAEAGTNAGSSSGASSGGESGGGATSADPSAIVEETAAGPTEAASGGAAAGDPAGMDDWESPPAEVTDADLNAAVQKKNGTLNDPPKIRALIGGYNPDPTKSFQLREIPQAQRAEFLAKLEALK